MKIAIWIIAIVEVIRAIQNAIQLWHVRRSNGNEQLKRATDAFVDSIQTDREQFIDEILEEYKRRKEQK